MRIETVEGKEGGTKLIFPKKFLWKRIFYNPAMEFVRDLNIIITQTAIKHYSLKNTCYLDILSGIGANGVRIANETNVEKVYLNEISKDAFILLKENVKINGIDEKVVLTNYDANKLFTKIRRKFDFIDIDPFGSPIYYLPFITKFLMKGSILSITATDTKTLFGLKADTALRRYGIKTVSTDFYREYGTRVLITATILTLARYSFLAKPIFPPLVFAA